MKKIQPYVKALLAGAIAFTGSVATAYADNGATVAEWWLSVSAGLTALGAVYGTPQRRATREE